MKQEPNLVIFRIPDESPTTERTSMRLVELSYLGGKLAETGNVFMPHPDSSYSLLDFDRVVLARTTAEGSLELGRYQIGSKGPTKPQSVGETLVPAGPVTIHKLSFLEIVDVVKDLCKLYQDAPEHHS